MGKTCEESTEHCNLTVQKRHERNLLKIEIV